MDEQSKSDRREMYGREHKLNKKSFPLCCYCLFLLIFVATMVYIFKGHNHIFTHMFHKSQFAKSVKYNSAMVKDLEGYPHNLTEMTSQNEQLCRLVSINSSISGGVVGSRGPGNIYIVKDEKNLTSEQACGVESILRLFPDKTIYLIDFNKEEDHQYSTCSVHPNYLGLLLLLYKDRLQLVKADKTEFFKYTPLQNFTSLNDSFVFLAMLVTAYKYGGLIASPDVAVVSRDPVECFPEETVVEPFAILAANKCDEFLHYLMQSFQFCGSVSNVSLETTLTEATTLYSNSQPVTSARRLAPLELCTTLADLNSSCSFFHPHNFDEEEKGICELSSFCKQVVQAYYGIRINKMQVAEETLKIKSTIKKNNGKNFLGKANRSKNF